MPTTLIAVSGLSPAIITETVWALARETPAVIPDDVVVITTTKGAEDIRRDLLTPTPEWGGISVWQSLRQTVLGKSTQKGALQFSAPRVIELPDPSTGIKGPAPDLRSREDNAAAADFILGELRRWVEDPDTRVVASIAGGRKTMGALLYSAMSLIGRPEDRVTHVLVREPFDTCRGFFFPEQPVQNLTVGPRDHPKSALARDANPELADIPFVTLRNLFERELATRPGNFQALVERARHKLADISRDTVTLDVLTDRPEIRVNGVLVTLSVPEYLIVLCTAKAAVESRAAIDGYRAAIPTVVATAQALYAKHDENDFSDWRFKALPDGKDGFDAINEEWITKKLDSLRAKLRKEGAIAMQLVPLLPKKGRFSLDLPPDKIRLNP